MVKHYEVTFDTKAVQKVLENQIKIFELLVENSDLLSELKLKDD